jgi:hypothetical protein
MKRTLYRYKHSFLEKIVETFLYKDLEVKESAAMNNELETIFNRPCLSLTSFVWCFELFLSIFFGLSCVYI